MPPRPPLQQHRPFERVETLYGSAATPVAVLPTDSGVTPTFFLTQRTFCGAKYERSGAPAVRITQSQTDRVRGESLDYTTCVMPAYVRRFSCLLRRPESEACDARSRDVADRAADRSNSGILGDATMKSAFVLAALVAAMTGISAPSLASSSVSFPANSLAVSGCPYNGPTGDGAVALYCGGRYSRQRDFPAIPTLLLAERAAFVPGLTNRDSQRTASLFPHHWQRSLCTRVVSRPPGALPER